MKWKQYENILYAWVLEIGAGITVMIIYEKGGHRAP